MPTTQRKKPVVPPAASHSTVPRICTLLLGLTGGALAYHFGHPWMARLRNTVPYSAPVAVLQSQPTFSADLWSGGSFEIRGTQDGYISKGSINGTPVSFLIDTGASHLTVPSQMAQRLGIQCDKKIHFSSANGAVTGCAGMATEVKFGPYSLKNVAISVAPDAQNILLGMDVLQRFTMIWDRGTLRLKETVPSSPLPPSGTVVEYPGYPAGAAKAPLRLYGNREGMHCVLRMDSVSSKMPVMSIFVRKHESAEVWVPEGKYLGRLMCGSTWYGADLFGANSLNESIQEELSFGLEQAGKVAGMQIDLTPRGTGQPQSSAATGK